MVTDREAWQVSAHGGHKESDTTERLNDKNNMHLSIRKTNSFNHKWAGDLNRHFCKEDINIANKHMKQCSIFFIIQSVQFSCSVVSISLWPHDSHHTRPLCPSPTPGVYSNLCPSSQWCHPAISSSVVPFSSCPQSLPEMQIKTTVRYHLTPVRMAIIKNLQKINAGENWRKGTPPTLSVGLYIDAATMNSMKILLKKNYE